MTVIYLVKVTAKKAGKTVSKTLTAKAKVVGAGLKITSEASEVNTGATLTLAVKKVPSTAKLTFASKDESIATVSADGVVTGVKAGKTTITVTSDYGKTVEKEITVVDAVAQLTDVKQTASNKITASFSADASKITKDDIKIAATDKSSELAVKSVEVAADNTAVITVFGNFTDAKDYDVTYKEVTKSFKASVGDVASVVVTTKEAPVNENTPINFQLFDATGIDVTEAKAVDSHCLVTVTGTYSGAELNTASKAKITMAAVGDEAEVTVTYNAATKDSQDVVGTATIKCVNAQAVKGTAMFKVSDDTKNDCARFYLGTPDTLVKVDENATEGNVFFCVTDANGDVVSFDKYEVESSNDDVATVSTSVDNGKFAQISVNGNTVGTAQINVTATKNGVASYYTIPVQVKKVGVPVKMTVGATKTSMSDSNDPDYSSGIEAKFYDADGNEVTSDVSYTSEITNESTGSGVVNPVLADNVFTAAKATAKTYTIKVTGNSTKTDKNFTGLVSISVKKLPENAWNNSKGASMQYQVELNKSVDIATTKDDAYIQTAKVYATCNGLFAGYVRSAASGDTMTIAAASDGVYADTKTALQEATIAVKYSNTYYDGTNTGDPSTLTYGDSEAKADAFTSVGTAGKVRFSTRTSTAMSASAPLVYEAGNDKNTTIAQTGTWTAEYVLDYKDASVKDVTKSNTFSVVNTVVVPTVTVTDRNVDSFSVSDIVKGLKTNVDMNNNTSDHESIIALIDKDNVKQDSSITATTNASNKATVKKAVVADTRKADTEVFWNFYLPINTTFTLK